MNICPNCGSNLKDGDKFCRKCGTKVELRNNDLKTLIKNISISDDDLINAYIGKNADKLKNGTFSANTFFLGSLYVLYRKMWLLGIGWLVVNAIVGAFLEPVSSAISIALSVVLGLKFKNLYLKHVIEEVNKIKIENNNATREELMMICTNKGGTSILGVILPIIIIFALSFFAVLTSHDTDEDFDIKDENNITNYYYDTINGMLLYSINYRIISDSNGTWKKVNSEIINSLEFK